MPEQLLSTDPQAGQLLSSEASAGVSTSKPASDHPILSAIASVTGISMPLIRNVLEEVATNPSIPRLAAKAGRVIGGLAPPVAGAVEGGPVGLLAGTAAAAKGAWAGGKTGWFTGKLAQNLATPLAKAASALEPYMPAFAALVQEGDTLHRLNSPESVAALTKALKPEQRYKILAHYRNQPEYAQAIMRAMK